MKEVHGMGKLLKMAWRNVWRNRRCTVLVPGTPVLVLDDLASLRVETTDLSERDVDRVIGVQSAETRIGHLSNAQTPHLADARASHMWYTVGQSPDVVSRVS